MLIEEAINYANSRWDKPFVVDPGIIRGADGEPLLHLVCKVENSNLLHKELRAMLLRLARDPNREHAADWSDGFFNERPLRFEAMSTTNPEDPLTLIPMVRKPAEYAAAIFYLLRTTPCVTQAVRTQPFEALSNRVAACEFCGSWHLIVTRKYCKFCSTRCRFRARNNLLKYGDSHAMKKMR